MEERYVKGNTLPEAYHKALKELWKNGTEVDCPAWNTQCLECAMTMVVKNPLGEPRISKYFPGGPYDLERYRQEMLDGILDFKIGHGWDYTYHDRIVKYPIYNYEHDDYDTINQIKFVLLTLKRDPNSRRAAIDVRDNAADMFSDDPACLQHIQFFIRNGKLDCSVLFRSNDALEATFMNAWALLRLQERIAKELDVGVGTYTHRANSFHCYKKDWDRLSAVAELTILREESTVTYRYDKDWKVQMEEAIPGILAKMEALKNGR